MGGGLHAWIDDDVDLLLHRPGAAADVVEDGVDHLQGLLAVAPEGTGFAHQVQRVAEQGRDDVGELDRRQLGDGVGRAHENDEVLEDFHHVGALGNRGVGLPVVEELDQLVDEGLLVDVLAQLGHVLREGGLEGAEEHGAHDWVQAELRREDRRESGGGILGLVCRNCEMRHWE
ncbi:hypothetical protein PG988_015946 [Apiospora saccharicola]